MAAKYSSLRALHSKALSVYTQEKQQQKQQVQQLSPSKLHSMVPTNSFPPPSTYSAWRSNHTNTNTAPLSRSAEWSVNDGDDDEMDSSSHSVSHLSGQPQTHGNAPFEALTFSSSSSPSAHAYIINKNSKRPPVKTGGISALRILAVQESTSTTTATIASASPSSPAGSRLLSPSMTHRQHLRAPSPSVTTRERSLLSHSPTRNRCGSPSPLPPMPLPPLVRAQSPPSVNTKDPSLLLLSSSSTTTLVNRRASASVALTSSSQRDESQELSPLHTILQQRK